MLTLLEQNKWKILAGIIFSAALVHSPSLFNDFTYWDDVYHITLNEHIKKISLQNLYTMCTSFYIGMYHPLTTFSFALNYALGGLNPFWYHLTNILLHLANIVLVFLLVQRITPKTVVALFAAAILALHPMHVESVAWATERKDVLYAFFFLFSYIFYLHYSSSTQKRSYVFSLLLFCAALLSKSAAVVLPLLLIITDWYVKRDWKKYLFPEKIPFLVLSGIFGVVSLLSQHAGEHPYFHASFEWYDRPFLSSYAFLFYIVKYFLPLNLSAIHAFPTKVGNFLPLEYYLAPVGVGILCAFLFLNGWNYQREYRFGLMFFFTGIALVLQIFPLGYALVAERYTYVPYVGISFFIGTLLDNLFRRWQKKQSLLFLLLVISFSFLGVATFRQSQVWKNTLTLFTSASNACKTEYARKNMLAFAYKLEGEGLLALNRTTEARKALQQSLLFNNEISETYYSLGVAYFKDGLYEPARENFEAALERDPGVPLYHKDLGMVYLRQRNFQKAIDHFSTAIALQPEEATYYNERGIAFLRSRQYEKALDDFSTALVLRPGWGKALANRGIIYFHLQQHELACRDFEAALQSGFAEARTLLQEYCSPRSTK